jgi:hypothetical protein
MTDYNNHADYKISWEECDKIVVHTLKYYRKLHSESNVTHPEDIKYNKKLKKSIDFILRYLGEADE